MSIVGPYLDVGRTIGRIAVRLISEHLESLTIRYQEDIAKEETQPMKVAVLSGFLEMMTNERVNIVNADIIAHSRSLNVTE